MIKILRYTLFLTLFLSFSKDCFAQFPYFESFKNSSAPGITFGGSPSSFLTAGGSAYDMTLGTHTGIPVDPNGNGYLRLTTNQRNEKGYAISTTNFPSSNGLSVTFEYYVYGGNGADGISFFLFDGTANPFSIGGFGGSLGYAQYTNTTPTTPGVSKGYLAVGLDEYGNFSNPIEGRQGGITGLIPGSITLRGKGDGPATVPANYPYLTSAKVEDFGFPLVGNGSLREPDPTSTGYRKVFIDMAPDGNVGYDITVRITKGGSPQLTSTIINNYHYTEAAPAVLRYGFASSTGDQTNFHEIRNVNIDTYNTNDLSNPTATNDALTLCEGKQAIVDATINDKTSNPGATIVKASIDLNPDTLGIQSTFAVAGKGTFSLNAEAAIQFLPETSFTGNVSCFYTIKDTYGRTSNAAKITLTYVGAPGQPNAGPDQVLNITTTTTGTAALAGTNPGANIGKWTQITGPSVAVITDTTKYNTTATNLTGGTYLFRWMLTSAGSCELSDDVQIIVNHIPVAVDDTVSSNPNTSVPIAVLANDMDADGNNTIFLGSISIKTQPIHGIIVIDPLTGIVTYTPTEGFGGLDSFTYTIKDNFGVESSLATVSISVNVKPMGINDMDSTVINVPVVVSVLTNDPGKANATVLKATDPKNGSMVIKADGTITYTPGNGFSGKDDFTYFLKNKEGLQSDPIKVMIDVRPTGATDDVSTAENTDIIISVKDNDLAKTGTTVIIDTNPANGSVVIDATGKPVFTPLKGFAGKDSFTYILRTTDGLNSEAVVVNVSIEPVKITAPDFNISSPIDKPLIIDIPKSLGSEFVITDPPKHGRITFDLVTGQPIYTPEPGYTGPDDFTYIIKDLTGNASFPGKVTLTIFTPEKIGLAKNLKAGPVKNIDGTYSLTYQFVLVNYGDVDLVNISLIDDLLNTFSGNTLKINQISTTGTLKSNNNYNGTSIKELIAPGSTLPKQSKEFVTLEVNVALDRRDGIFSNTATTEGTSEGGGTKVSDVSTDGLNPDPIEDGDVTPSVATPVKIVKQDLFIPGGFSPNNDGINDFFFLENTKGKQISLEVYNRWGNLIYRSKSYENDWAGKTTEGIHIGDDVPAGTYYYTIKIDGKDKRVGYITITR
jgi:gliding motility-associated-like protein